MNAEERVIGAFTSRFGATGQVQRRGRVWLTVEKDRLLDVCRFAKEEMGFVHLSSLSVTDWVEDGEYELTYHLWSYEEKILLTVKTRIERDKPEIPSLVSLWGENAQAHEREMHEMFGVDYIGNPDLSPLFLEEWDGPPPFRKDFDWREYVRSEYYDVENPRERVYFGGD
ncbi:MAG: NADH-quinone oxidoreductase subunit C [Thermoplasmata archaeon]|nr:NADH-quinone oxidoreductase subunit C [Thermoplasmata archaeon]